MTVWTSYPSGTSSDSFTRDTCSDGALMTIEFNCPHCGALIAFDSKHAGQRAKCLKCDQKFLIPSESFQKAEKVAPEPKPREEPIPGFYRAVFLDSWRIFFRRQSVTPLAFV